MLRDEEHAPLAASRPLSDAPYNRRITARNFSGLRSARGRVRVSRTICVRLIGEQFRG